ncbi:2-oxoisovalerate dehydrogenase subunit alpha [Planctomycetes bacterium Pla163]|uniref:2-oxoisovalerate dehydrogenase subunit alpha n=2 Tax=Rohdeia mirabilis TaxID=2528008 RepID=A0A518D3Y8_9BACT|nr:2-oxoisovalerate dehydrogenase subunit alpha [Planctomycetes bacterium Pla163]
MPSAQPLARLERSNETMPDSLTTPEHIASTWLDASPRDARDADWLRSLMSDLILLQVVDERMLKLQRSGRIGFVGSMRGLEGMLVGAGRAIPQSDWLWSGLREGGAALIRGLPLSEYIAQMYCNSFDTAKGRQMCNHFQHAGTHYPSWSSVIGTQIPHGVGAAFASKQKGDGAVHTIFFGDGATSSNGFHSGLNMAAVWKAPCVFVCVDNGWAISVSSRDQTASKGYAVKAKAYGMPGVEVDGNDVVATHDALVSLIERARAGEGPALLVLKTYRLMGHSSSDDPTKYRDQREVDEWLAKDPVPRFEQRLVADGVIDAAFLERTFTEHRATVDAEIHVQEAADAMPLRSLVDDVYSGVPRHLRRQYNEFLRVSEKLGEARRGDGAFPL